MFKVDIGIVNVRIIEINVEGMICMFCVKIIEGIMFNKLGVKSIKVFFIDKCVVIEYDEVVIILEDLRVGIEDMGFDVLFFEGSFKKKIIFEFCSLFFWLRLDKE